MTISQAVALLAGVGVPFAVDLLTKSNAPRALKSFLAAALAALAGVLATNVYVDGADWKVYLRNIATAWVVALATHYTGATNPVQRATADIGIGPSQGGGA